MKNTLSIKRVGKAFLFALLFITSVLPKAAKAQQTFFSYDERTFFEADCRFGKYFPFEERHAYMKVLPQYGLDLRMGRQTDGRMQWEKDFNHLSYGAFLRFEKNNVDSVQFVDRDENGYERETWRALGDCYSLGGFSYQFSHSSNAAFRLPNCGINVLSWMVGLRYHPKGRPELIPQEQPRPKFQKSTAIFATESVGLLQTNEWMRSYQTADGTMVSDLPDERPYYMANVIQLGVHRQFHPKFSYDVALDFGWTGESKRMYEKAHQNYNDGHEYFTGDDAIPLMEYSFARGLHLAPSVMFEINYNRFAFCIGGAYYLWHGIYYGTDQKKTWGLAESSESNFEDTYLPPCYRTFYERLGFKYYLGENRNMFVGSFMKVHEAVIDYAEFTFGINLFSWKD